MEITQTAVNILPKATTRVSASNTESDVTLNFPAASARRQHKRASERGDANRGACAGRAGRRQAGRARRHARRRHLLHPGVAAGLHHTHHCGWTEYGG